MKFRSEIYWYNTGNEKLNDFKILCYMYNLNLLEQLLKNLHQSKIKALKNLSSQ